jgi:FkbH-like protein
VERCLELVQRSNQLNLSKRAYTREQFEELLATPGILGLALAAEDRFGDYGIIGFVAVDEREETPAVRDLVLSCRIAQKHVEHAFFRWLAERETARGAAGLRAELVHTSRNGPLQRVFEELPFSVSHRDGERTLFELDLPAPPGDEVVAVRDLVAV